MKKILVIAVAALVLIGIGVFTFSHIGGNKGPACNSAETLQQLRKNIDAEFGKTMFMVEEFEIKAITQRSSKVSDTTNVCSGTATIKFSLAGYAERGGDVDLVYTTQKTLDNTVKVSVYRVGNKELKTLQD